MGSVRVPSSTRSRTNSATKKGLPSVRSRIAAATSSLNGDTGPLTYLVGDAANVQACQREPHRVGSRQPGQSVAQSRVDVRGRVPSRDHQHERQRWERGRTAAQQSQAVGVGPVHVVEDEQRGSGRAQRGDQGAAESVRRGRDVGLVRRGQVQDLGRCPRLPRAACCQPASGGASSASQDPRPTRNPREAASAGCCPPCSSCRSRGHR